MVTLHKRDEPKNELASNINFVATAIRCLLQISSKNDRQGMKVRRRFFYGDGAFVREREARASAWSWFFV
ncbi:uncharacterized protein G2W53_017282 [Senna tora]|uniref:Uncharacterized protein n=1 Tax=Senna tora TaxID=362788 RepID=A0A834TPN2_9FABA|nr:uncharacterized protein G2W53_017282 [Senna tora]